MEFGIEQVDLTKVDFTASLLHTIPPDLVHRYRVLPVAEMGNRLSIALADPTRLDVIDELNTTLGREIEMRQAESRQIDMFIARFYGQPDA